jgi:CRISPR-associated protein Csb2
VVTQFVPVNDKAGPSKALMHSLPLARDRQPRIFARAALADDTLWLTWPNAEPEPKVRDALARLCGKVTRVGHSISLVQMWLADAVPPGPQRWVPDGDRAILQLRITAPGTLDMLDGEFRAAPLPKGPRLSMYQGYAVAQEAVTQRPAPGTVFSPHLLVFSLERRDGPYRSLDLLCTLVLTERWREALASQANDLSPQAQSLICGHAPDGGPLQTPHVAFLPLGFVGHPHADGRLPGMALALPGYIAPETRAQILRAAAKVCEQGLVLGRLGAWHVQPVTMARPLETLRAATWTAHPSGATHWGTVTPIAFDQHPKAKNKAESVAELTEIIRAACERVGLPSPREIIVTPVSAHLGAPPAHAFLRLRRKDGSERRHIHAIVVFDQPVRGPVIFGAGRYRGYGLCRPMEAQP